MERFALFTRRVNGLFLALSGMLAAAILLVLAYDLVARNVFDAPTVWALNVSRFLLIFLFFLAVAPALESGAHVAVDIVEHYLGETGKRLLRGLALLLVLVFGVLLMWQVTRTTYEAFVEDALFPTVLPVKHKHVYWVAPVGVLQFLLTAVALLLGVLRRRP